MSLASLAKDYFSHSEFELDLRNGWNRHLQLCLGQIDWIVCGMELVD